jgi:hypothetical protein
MDEYGIRRPRRTQREQAAGARAGRRRRPPGRRGAPRGYPSWALRIWEPTCSAAISSRAGRSGACGPSFGSGDAGWSPSWHGWAAGRDIRTTQTRGTGAPPVVAGSRWCRSGRRAWPRTSRSSSSRAPADSPQACTQRRRLPDAPADWRAVGRLVQAGPGAVLHGLRALPQTAARQPGRLKPLPPAARPPRADLQPGRARERRRRPRRRPRRAAAPPGAPGRGGHSTPRSARGSVGCGSANLKLKDQPANSLATEDVAELIEYRDLVAVFEDGANCRSTSPRRSATQTTRPC